MPMTKRGRLTVAGLIILIAVTPLLVIIHHATGPK